MDRAVVQQVGEGLVSMESGLEDRNNMAARGWQILPGGMSQWSPA